MQMEQLAGRWEREFSLEEEDSESRSGTGALATGRDAEQGPWPMEEEWPYMEIKERKCRQRHSLGSRRTQEGEWVGVVC